MQRLTHPKKIMYPKNGITKLDLLHYYEKVKNQILPYITQRFLTVVRCPEGVSKECFYQRHVTQMKSSCLFSAEYKKNKKIEKYFYIKNEKGLFALVQLGVLEIHTWNCRIDKPNKPDMIVFDLDPDPLVDWKSVIDTAFVIKEELRKLKLTCFVKTTGGKGLHIVIPIKRLYTWDKIKLFAHTFVQYLEQLYPDRYTSTISKKKREGKIFIDYLRNQPGATSIAPFSTRAKAHASIAMPLAWDDLSNKIKSDHFTMMNFSKQLNIITKNPWKTFHYSFQILPVF